ADQHRGFPLAPHTVSDSTPPRPFFAPTRWSLVLRAKGDSPEARAALSELCAAYCEPVLRSLRSRGFEEDHARDLSQDFFTHVLQGGHLDGADPRRGRFRSYLLGALKHFLSDLHERNLRLKRGGGVLPESLEHLPEPAADGGWDDARFDRDWAMALMARSLATLAGEYRQAGRGEWFEQLEPWLAGSEPTDRQSEAAARLGLTEGALKVAIHRLRKRFRETLLKEIRQTLPEEGDAEDELRYLIEILIRP
ncbi:MAG: sigma-70 family RNA polymerase sigma factor, partial [Verrucomicrobiae bacterium]|nr:sigma-70 family RNA polymerase sigma factor [Verrucomicrobiae bacterium]